VEPSSCAEAQSFSNRVDKFLQAGVLFRSGTEECGGAFGVLKYAFKEDVVGSAHGVPFPVREEPVVLNCTISLLNE